MNIGQLKEKLKNYPQNTFVIVRNEETNNFSFVNDISFLNLAGAYKWTLESGDVLPREMGKVISFLTTSEQKNSRIESDKPEEFTQDYDYYRMAVTNAYDIMSSDDFIEKINSLSYENVGKPKDSGNIDESLISTHHNMIKDVMILPKNTSLVFMDTYGHDSRITSKNEIICFVIGEKIRNEYDPITEKKVMSWKEFNK